MLRPRPQSFKVSQILGSIMRGLSPVANSLRGFLSGLHWSSKEADFACESLSGVRQRPSALKVSRIERNSREFLIAALFRAATFASKVDTLTRDGLSQY